MPLHSLASILAEFGLAMTCMSPNRYQTIGGAVATGAHGSSIKHGSMSDAIIALDVVMSNGEAATPPQSPPKSGRSSNLAHGAQMCHISTTENAELLDGARVSLGTLGVLYSVTIQCER